MNTVETIHCIDRPWSPGVIEVYGELDMGWYEWRIIDHRGEVSHDTGRHGSDGMQYGSASLALRDGLNHDEPPKPQAPAVVRIQWLDRADAASENLAQAHRSLDILRGMATELVNEAYNAKIQRSVMNPDHPNGRLGMIYTDERTATTEHAAQVLNDAADNLLIFAHNMTEQEPEQ